MHEFGIAQGLLASVLAKLAEHHAARIEIIRMQIGVLSGVETEPLTFAFTSLAEGTPAEGSRLEIEKIPLRCFCSACDAAFECRPFAYQCPTCGKASSDVRSGKEMNLIAMEVS